MENARIESRQKVSGGILYSYLETQRRLDTFSGLLSNISDNGACIYTQESIEQGSRISIYGKTLRSQEPKTASVIWCNRIYDDLYMVGLLFPRA